MYRVVIPARFASTRLPGKPLIPIGGRPVLQWVFERACRTRAAEVIVATDDERIRGVAADFGATVAMTSASHPSGTDRIAEVARERRWCAHDIVVNLQGDEPLMPPALVEQVAALLAAHPHAQMATVSAPIRSLDEYLDPNAVKVVCDGQGRALYFSRAPVPWNRDVPPVDPADARSFAAAERHIGLYAYRVDALLTLAALPPGRLEQLEKLEQLRALENGFDIRVARAVERPGPDINTPEDLERVTAELVPGND